MSFKNPSISYVWEVLTIQKLKLNNLVELKLLSNS